MRKAAIVLIYVLFLGSLFEGTARLAFIIPPVARRLRADEDYTHRRAWIQRHREKNVNAFYTFDIYDPSTGWRVKPNVTNLKAFDSKQNLNTNAKGLRGKKNFSYRKKQGTIRILILGDSFTFGDDVSDEDTYSSYLQRMLPEVEVINMGVHGYGHDQMLILLKEEGIKYEPDIIILGFLPLDMPRNLLTFSDFAKPRFVLKSGRLKLTGVPVPPLEDILRGDWARPRIVDVFSLIRLKVKKVLGLHR